jgi:O-antigen/teichoic acid export membrane protein
MTVNAVSLMVATFASSALGLVFWAVAAHVHGAAAVGGAFAEVSALTLLATLAQLNMTNVFIRLLPVAGRFTGTFIARGYVAVIAVALVVGSAFVASGLGSDFVQSGTPERVLFVAAVVLFAIFALQDSVLTALRIAHWVPVENTTFASVKLALLPLFAFLPARLGPVVAWVLPVAVAVLAVNYLLFRGPVARTRRMQDGELPQRRRLLSFLAAEYACNLVALATLQVLPLIVLWRLGAVSEAYFTLPWLVCMSITLLLWNIGASFVVAAAANPAETRELLGRSFRLGGAVVLGAVLACSLGGSLILRVAGADYAEHGSSLIRLLGLSAPFTAVIVVYSAFAWLEQRLWRLVAIQAGSGMLLIGVTFALLPQMGVVAVGWAYLAAQGIAATAMAPALRARLGGTDKVSATAIPLEGLP